MGSREESKKSKKQPMHKRPVMGRFQRYFVAGAITLIPIFVTWFFVMLMVRFFSSTGKPMVDGLYDAIHPVWPGMAELLRDPLFQNLLSVVFVLIVLTVVGFIATRVLGRRFISAFDSLMDRIPMVRMIYNSMKRLMVALQRQPEHVQRVVLIEFPSENMKTVGLVTRTLTDKDTGKKLAAVYVPTTPNPTSGYLEIVPVERVVSTDWTIDEAMTFIISGGAVGPERMNYEKSSPSRRDPQGGKRDAFKVGSDDLHLDGFKEYQEKKESGDDDSET